jgi:hypothetical protein
MGMNYGDKIITSVRGRRLGLQVITTGIQGGRKAHEYLVGPDALRMPVTTAETTATNVLPFGVSYLPGTSAASSAVYTIDPPVPGVEKTVVGGTDNGPVYLKTKNGETIESTIGSTFNTVKISSLGGAFKLVGLTTGIWAAIGITSGTSSQASGFGVTTST